MPFDLGAVLIILQLIYLEGILSIDNAAVLGALVAHLPRHEAIPWPRPLRLLQHPAHRLLGGQQGAALKAGLLGAYVGRGAMLFVASWVIRNQWLLLLGGAYLIYLAFSHFGGKAEDAEARERHDSVPMVARTFWVVVLNVELADLAFSLDNVVAAVALSREMWVVLVGVFLGIVTMRFAAMIFTRMIEREPILEATAYLLVFVIALELFAEQLGGVHLSHTGKFLVSLGVIASTLLYARMPALQALGRRMWWLRRGLAMTSRAVRVVFAPLGWAARRTLRAGTSAVRSGRHAVRARRERRVAGSAAAGSHEAWPGGNGGA